MSQYFQPLGRLFVLAVLAACVSGCVSQPAPFCAPDFKGGTLASSTTLENVSVHHDPLCLEALLESPLPPAQAYQKKDGDGNDAPQGVPSVSAKLDTSASSITATTTITLAKAKPDPSSGGAAAPSGGGAAGHGAHAAIPPVSDAPVPPGKTPPTETVGGEIPNKDVIAGRLSTMYSQGLTYCLYVKNHNAKIFGVSLAGVNLGNIAMAAAPVIASSLGANTETIGIVSAIQLLFGQQLTSAISGGWKQPDFKQTQDLMTSLNALAATDENYKSPERSIWLQGFYRFRVALEGACFNNDGYPAGGSDGGDSSKPAKSDKTTKSDGS